MHQQCTGCETCCTGCGILPAITTALLFFLVTTASRIVRALLICALIAVALLAVTVSTLWWWSTIVALLLSVAGSGVVVSPLAVVLVHEDPAVFTPIPFSIPWRGDWWWLRRVLLGRVLRVTLLLLLRWVLGVAWLLLLLLILLTRTGKVGYQFA